MKFLDALDTWAADHVVVTLFLAASVVFGLIAAVRDKG